MHIDPDPDAIETLYAGRYLQLQCRDDWEFVSRHHPVVAMIAWTDQDELVLVEQHRKPINQRTIEIPAGLVGDHAGTDQESLETAARRELEEETGYRAGRMTELMRVPTSAGMTNEEVVFFLAQDLQKVSAGGGDDSEDITVHVIARDRIDDWLAAQYQAGWAIDPKIYAALYWSLSAR